MSENTWYQQALTPAVVLEFNLRVGVIPTEDHAQILVEMKDPTTGVLVGQWSMPHTTMRDLPIHLGRAYEKLDEWLATGVEPF